MANARQSALHAQSMGRNGDTILMHVNEKELMGLAGLGKITGHNITINPHTGLPEAFSFGDILPWVLGAAAIALTAGAAAPAVAAAEGAAAAGTGVAAATAAPVALAGTTAAEAAAAGTAAAAAPVAGGIGALGADAAATAATLTPEAAVAANTAATAPIVGTELAAPALTPAADVGSIYGTVGSDALAGAGGTDGLAATTQAAESGFTVEPTAFDSAIPGAPDMSAPVANNSINAAGSGGAYSPEVADTFTTAPESWGAKGLRWAGDAADWAIEHPTPTVMGLSYLNSIIPSGGGDKKEKYDPKKHPTKSFQSGQMKNARYQSPGANYNGSYEHSFFPGYSSYGSFAEGGEVAPSDLTGTGAMPTEGVNEFLAGLQANAGSPEDFIAQLASNPKTATLLPMIEQIMKGRQPQRINRQSSMDTPVEQRRGYKKGGGVSRAEQDAINKAIDERYAPHNWSNGDAMTKDPNIQQRMGPWWLDGTVYPSGRATSVFGNLSSDATNEDILYDAITDRNKMQYAQSQNKGRLDAMVDSPYASNKIDHDPLVMDYYTMRIKRAQEAMRAEGRGPGGGYADGGAVAAQSGGGYGTTMGDSAKSQKGNNALQGMLGFGNKGTTQDIPSTPQAPPSTPNQPFTINTDQWVGDFGPNAVQRMGFTPSQTPNWRSQIPVNNGPLVMRQPVPSAPPQVPAQQMPVQQQPAQAPINGPMRGKRGGFDMRMLQPGYGNMTQAQNGSAGYGQTTQQIIGGSMPGRNAGWKRHGSAFAEGGEVMDGEQESSDQIVAGAIQAIQSGGQDPSAQQAIAIFVQTFGQKALSDLIKRVSAMTDKSQFRAPDGSLSGPGDGQSDSIPAVIDGEAPASLSTGEHVIDKLTVDAAGGGDNAAGHDVLNRIKEGLRTKAYGSPQLPQPGNVNRILRG